MANAVNVPTKGGEYQSGSIGYGKYSLFVSDSFPAISSRFPAGVEIDPQKTTPKYNFGG
jgi:hypothetical protein